MDKEYFNCSKCQTVYALPTKCDHYMEAEISSLKEQLEREKKTVDFYADKDNWVEVCGANIILNDEYVSDNYYGKSGGRLARETQEIRVKT